MQNVRISISFSANDFFFVASGKSAAKIWFNCLLMFSRMSGAIFLLVGLLGITCTLSVFKEVLKALV